MPFKGPELVQIATGLFHSFARRAQQETLDEAVVRSSRVLESILLHGLLLLPERVDFNNRAHWNDTSLSSFQLRSCFTMLTVSELADHSKFFGPLSIEITMRCGRELGLIPVFYVPQPLGGQSRILFDQLAYALLERLADIQSLLDDVAAIWSTLEQNEQATEVEFAAKDTGEYERFDPVVLKRLVAFLGHRRHSFNDLSGAVQVSTSLFYPTDKPVERLTEFESEFFYYAQREWRVLSHFRVMGNLLDGPLTPDEAEAVLMTDPEFFSEEVQLGMRSVSRLNACRIIRDVEERPFRERIERIWAPANYEKKVAEVLAKFDCENKLVTYQYEQIR